MADTDASDRPTEDGTELVDKNGLVKLFANRARARILVTLFYADESLTANEIADGAGVNRSVVQEALDPLGTFDLLETFEGADEDPPRYLLEDGDELVEAVRTLAELATERFYDGD
jgi:DNA-binding GntR family transcriptional regulator